MDSRTVGRMRQATFAADAHSDKNECTDKEKGSKKITVWKEMGYNKVCMIDTNNEREYIAKIIEARNKYKMLRTCKEKATSIARGPTIFRCSASVASCRLGKTQKGTQRENGGAKETDRKR